jgi:hypothetical protein
MMRSFDLVGTIHGREYSDYGKYVTADDYYDLQLYSEAVARLKLGMETDLENLKNENESLRADAERYRWLRGAKHFDSPQHRAFCEFYADGLDLAIDAAISSLENH